MKRNWPGAARIQFIKGNHGFYNGAKPKFFEIDFLGRKLTNIVLEYTKSCGIATFGGVCFLRKVHFVYIFMRKSRFQIFEIIMELHYNLKSLKSLFSHENIDKMNFSQKTYPPKCCYSATFGILQNNIGKFFGPKSQFQFFQVSSKPNKSVFCLEKNNLIKKKLRKWRLKNLSSIIIVKILNYNFINFLLIKLSFLTKPTAMFGNFLYVG